MGKRRRIQFQFEFDIRVLENNGTEHILTGVNHIRIGEEGDLIISRNNHSDIIFPFNIWASYTVE